MAASMLDELDLADRVILLGKLDILNWNVDANSVHKSKPLIMHFPGQAVSFVAEGLPSKNLLRLRSYGKSNVKNPVATSKLPLLIEVKYSYGGLQTEESHTLMVPYLGAQLYSLNPPVDPLPQSISMALFTGAPVDLVELDKSIDEVHQDTKWEMEWRKQS